MHGEPALADSALLGALLKDLAAQSPAAAQVLSDPAGHRLQILLGVIDSEGALPPTGRPRLARHGYRCDAEYFYPASTVKLAGAAVALGALRRLASRRAAEVVIDAPMTVFPCFPGDPLRRDDETNVEGGRLTVGHEIRKALIVSDNPAFNNLYSLVGHRELNLALRGAGVRSAVLNHRLSEFRTVEEQRRTPRVEVLAEDGQVLTVPPRESDLLLDNAGVPGVEAGASHVDPATGDVRRGAMSFLHKNRMTLADLQTMLLLVARPDLVPDEPGFDLLPRERSFLVRALSELPRESSNPRLDPSEFPDHHSKPLLPGLRRLPGAGSLRVTNKLGRAYGFTTENALVTDRGTGRAFALACTLWTCPSGHLGGDGYDYALADAFLADLSALLGARLLGARLLGG